MHNSPLREEPREQRAGVIPLKHESSLLDWLQATGRLISRDTVQETDFVDVDEDDVSGLLDSDDVGDIYDDDDDLDMEIDEET